MQNYEFISSRTNRFVVDTAKLTDAKFRKAGGQFLCEGVKLCRELSGNRALSAALIREDELAAGGEAAALFADAARSGIRAVVLSGGAFDKISTEGSPQGIIFVCSFMKGLHDKCEITDEKVAALSDERIFILDGIQDCGNLGTIIRSASAFSVDRLILSGCADIYSNKTVRASMGALFRMKISETDDLKTAVKAFAKKRRVLAAALSDCSTPLGMVGLSKNDIVIIGNEGHGISHSVIAECTGTVKIPMAAGSESLNAAVAASLIMYEANRAQ